MEETVKTVGKQLQPYHFKPGVSGNPAGRPKGSISIKDLVRQYLENNTHAQEEFVKHFVLKNRDLAWRMLEGNPAQATDLTTGGKPFNFTKISFDDYDPDTIQPKAE